MSIKQHVHFVLTVRTFLKYSILALTGKGLFLKSLRQPASCWVVPSFW